MSSEEPLPAQSGTEPPHGPNVVLLRHQREEADRNYNEALTTLDQAVGKLRTFPAPPPPLDDSQVTPLNERWALLARKPEDGTGWLGWLRRHIWATVAPVFQQQQDFNATLVDHVNRNVASHQATVRALTEALTTAREEQARLVAFQSVLVCYAQKITAYVDTRDRYVESRPHTLEALTSELADEVRMRWESMLARDRRFQAEVEELRTTLGIAHRAILTVKHGLEETRSAVQLGVAAPGSVSAVDSRTSPAGASPAAGDGSLNSYKYVGFEDQFRGAQADIRERMRGYVRDFAGCSDVLDIGCGRGEFLDLLREAGISARGVDINAEMVAMCRDRDLQATTTDALSYLQAQPEGSLGGLIGAQVVEHLDPDYLLRLLEAAHRVLRPGSVMVLETINPACWFAFFSSYIRDITHVRPLHPDTLRYLTLASGFQRAEVRFASPFPEASKLQPVAVPPGSPVADAAATLNQNVEKLNGLLFTYLDYAVIARRD